MKTWIILATIGLTACTPRVVQQLPYYKMAVVQGMPLDSDAVMSLTTGMTQEQVELTLGKPLLNPSFRDNQWHYDYEVTRGGDVKEKRDLTVYFNENRLSHISGSALDYAREQFEKKHLLK